MCATQVIPTVGPTARRMNTTEARIARRRVIEAYAVYDCKKKGRPLPPLDGWSWDDPNQLDEDLSGAGLKPGVLAGYRYWDVVEIDEEDLQRFAVVASIFPGQPRALGQVDPEAVASWRPHTDAAWYGPIAEGRVLSTAEPLVLRPAVQAERPASWYAEDGSGRAVALFQNRDTLPDGVLAVAYLGREPDERSSFMGRPPFDQLLEDSRDGPTGHVSAHSWWAG